MTRTAQEHTFTTFDDTRLFYRHWPATTPSAKGAVVMFHRGHEHSGRMQHIVDELGLEDFAFFAWDARGHGASPGPRGDAPSVGALVRDVETFVDHIVATHNIRKENMTILAQSVGAVLAAAWVHDYAPPVRAMILASPAFSVKLYVPLALPALRLRQKLTGNFFINSYVKAKFLTHDAVRVASYKNDPLITRAISARILTGLYSTADRIIADAASIQVPTQLLISGADFVVRHYPQHAFYNALPCPHNERHVLDGFFHDTLGEEKREKAFEHIRTFIAARYAAPRWEADLTASDKAGPSAVTMKWLQTPYPCLSAKGLYYKAGRVALKTLGTLSEGVRLGLDTGFDSGSTLDYVYRNNPKGAGPLGRAIDTAYLNSPGWTGIRARKVCAEALITQAAAALHAEGRPVHILDIAAGHGRYILDALKELPVPLAGALLRDYSPLNVEAGNKAIRTRNLEDKVRFVQGDAFNAASIADVTPRPTLAVVSGLYELFPDNTLIRESLRGLSLAVEPGGYLVYTNQPWHPQLEYIARVLTSHQGGKAWAMRCRSQAEMDQLVACAGFHKIAQRVDEQGIFTVSLARRDG